jgi:hypothetical protein
MLPAVSEHGGDQLHGARLAGIDGLRFCGPYGSWRHGSSSGKVANAKRCTGTERWDLNGNAFNCGKGYSYSVAGMQELVTAVRRAGARNLVLLAGIGYANDLSQRLKYKPRDPRGNIAASWHVYPSTACATMDCWNRQVARVASAVPLVATEIGEADCRGDFVVPAMKWLDEHGGSYQAWVWNAWGCANLQLMTDYRTGRPTGYGRAIRNHFRELAAP